MEKRKNDKATERLASAPTSGSIARVLHCWLIAVLIIYFAVATLGKKNLQQEEIEATRLQIEVLKLELKQLENPKQKSGYYTWKKGVGYVQVK
jgi:hypothetical protein